MSYPDSSRTIIHRGPGVTRVEVTVLFVESRSAVRVIVGPGVGALDGGSHQTWLADEVPADLRRAGARFWMELAPA